MAYHHTPLIDRDSRAMLEVYNVGIFFKNFFKFFLHMLNNLYHTKNIFKSAKAKAEGAKKLRPKTEEEAEGFK